MPTTAHINNFKTCQRCGVRYDWRKSPSGSLKMTYCGSLCERAALGFTIEGMLQRSSTGRVAPRLAPWPVAA